MLERAIRLKDTLFSRHHLAITQKRMVETATPIPSFENKFQYFYSKDDIDQSKHDSYEGDESMMSKRFDSFSIDPRQKFDNRI